MNQFSLKLNVCPSRTLQVNLPTTKSSLSEILHSLHLDQDSFYFTCDGRLLGCDDVVYPNSNLVCNVRLHGGKGGFGSMLRAMGSQIEKTTNREACRDLSGRRMRDVNNEKKMLEWIKKKAEEDKVKEQEKIEKLERQLEKPKHFFNDPEYEKQLETASDNVHDALKDVLSKEKEKPTKRKSNAKEDEVPAKKEKWLGMMDDSDSDSDSDDSDDTDIPGCSKAQPIQVVTGNTAHNPIKVLVTDRSL